MTEGIAWDSDEGAVERGRSLLDQGFTRAAGAARLGGNRVRLLRDAAENYPAWLEAIARAERFVHFESYIIRDDVSGRAFAEALMAKAREGVAVRLLYDWMGAFRKTPARFWATLRGAGVEVRCFNPFRLASPLGWVHRDHRKSLVVDGVVGYVTGLCVGDAWVGDPARGIAPWRDTGIEVRGPAVAEIARAFGRVWAAIGPPLAGAELPDPAAPPAPAGDVAMRIIASEPARGGLLRVDELVAAAARETLWLTDAYFAGIPSYVQALSAAARDGVDVRLLVPGGTDIPILRPLSRAGYRPLLEAGVRVFEWNGPMMHAKTAVADGVWARVGSSNLNVASWIGNYELDAVMEDAPFARLMLQQYEWDLTNATEVLLHAPRAPRRLPRGGRRVRGTGSAGRAIAGAVRLGNTATAAVANRRVLQPAEARVVAACGAALLVLAGLALRWPRLLAWPLAVLLLWFGGALVARAWRLHRRRQTSTDRAIDPDVAASSMASPTADPAAARSARP
ncbi:MAG TPA: phospholipase D-like domain-containing protein [Gemmatimonadales bacterium]|nr:phospholipase D-like domain-containing protein [Gemmatimonadales bacterium]